MRARSARVTYVTLGLIFSIAVLGLIALFLSPQLAYRSKLKMADKVISRVESFKSARGTLPESLSDVGLTDEEANVFYRKESDDRYIVWFGTTLGESMTYDSQSRRWK